MKKKWSYIIGLFLLMFGIFTGCEALSGPLGIPEQDAMQGENRKDDSEGAKGSNEASDSLEGSEDAKEVQEDGEYTSKEEVAAYLYQYGHLPENYITKKDAKALGWVSSEGNLGEVAPGKSIGGDYFGNYEEILPKKEGRHYYECDIDTDGSYRGAKRIIYSDDGLIYYTEDHYATFELLYTKDGLEEK